MTVPSFESQLKTLFGFLNPIHMTVSDDSDSHKNHWAMAKRAEGDGKIPSHVSITLVSETFAPLNRIQRHRLIHHHMGPYFQGGLHALSLILLTPPEWHDREKAPKK